MIRSHSDAAERRAERICMAGSVLAAYVMASGDPFQPEFWVDPLLASAGTAAGALAVAACLISYVRRRRGQDGRTDH